MKHMFKLLLALTALAVACSDTSTESAQTTTGDQTTVATSTALVIESVGPAVAATEIGAANSGGGRETAETSGLPEPFEVLFSLFELDGNYAVGFSPFESSGPNCIEAQFTLATGSLRVFAAGVTDGISCRYAPLVTGGTKGDILACSEIRFLLTDMPVETLATPGAALFASVTSPAVPEGSNWIGARFSGPISADEIPTLDSSALGCVVEAPVELDPDVPEFLDGVTQRVSIVKIEGGVQVSYTSLGDSAAQWVGESDVDLWGEVIVDDGGRIEVRHEDGRYLTLVATGGPGPITAELCLWEQEPADTMCAP